MSDAIITVENLGKCYRLQHQQQRQRYVALRDVITSQVKGLFSKRQPPTANRQAEEDFWALKGVSFEIKQGEVVGIIGRNGAGKSTLLKILSRITDPTKGRITLRGRIASLLEVGTGFHPELTGRENVFLNGAILGMTRAEIREKFDEIVAFAEVEKFLDTPVKRYSSGMYVRLAFAVAAHLEPEILIVDEVLAVGDVTFQKKCLGKMQEVSTGGRTVLFVSHQMPAVLNLCSRVVLLAGGEVKGDGLPNVIVSEYLQEARRPDRFFTQPTKRRGNQLVRISGFEVRPANLRLGDPVEFCFELEPAPTVTGTMSVEVAVSCQSPQGAKLFQIYSKDTGVQIEVGPGGARWIARVEHCNLVQGDYLLTVWVGQGQTPFDWLQDCYTLQVAPGSFVENCYVEDWGYPMSLPARWQKGGSI
ncbi:MAG: hypothetical protein RLZZ265_3866 [Verrucomicrobiota bacterium]|jgi:lipopolysaccharide transport system ATP-binding protein